MSGYDTPPAAPLVSPGSHDAYGTSDWVVAYINGDGTVCQVPSSVTVKTDLTPMDETAILDLQPYWGRYRWDDPDSPLKVFLLA